jgi:hypothetical protein
MTQVHMPVKVIVKEDEKLHIAVANEMSFKDNRQLFLSFVEGKVAESGKH